MQLLLTSDLEPGIQLLHDRLTAELSNDKHVLWFLSGGSNIAIAVTVMAQLDADLTTNLTLTLIDERYGPVGHKDSNWQQLLDAGLQAKQATCVPVLQADDASIEATTDEFAAQLERLFSQNDVVVGLFGMGSDGHIAGILPDSPATEADGLATYYETETYNRITATFEAICMCHVGYLFAVGLNKHAALTNLERELPLEVQPAQILKQLPEAYIYNDQIGDKL